MTAAADKNSTPMMLQYRRAKASLSPGTLLFFRLGDFYEMFFDDALEGSELLGLTLTKRQGVPMCGIPYHAAEMYLGKLLKAGRKVALCDQMEDPALAKGLVKREVTSIVTPGTVLSESVLDAGKSNYLAGVHRSGKAWGLAMLELSTGEFWMEETGSAEAACADLALQSPAEVIVPESLHRDAGFAAALAAAGALLHYVTHDLRRSAAHVRGIRFRAPGDAMALDEATLANLDLVESRMPPRTDAPTTLLGVLDTTRTPMGTRLLRSWIVRPLRSLEGIAARHDSLDALLGSPRKLEELRAGLGKVKDVERLLGRLGSGTGNARDMRALAGSLGAVPGLKAVLGAFEGGRLDALKGEIGEERELVELLERALVDEPPLSVKEGGIIREGYNAELDELRDAATHGKQWLAEMQAREIERTGIKSLKIRYNRVFGYFIEVTKSNLGQVPEDYIRRQTLATGERFVTPELKEYENKIRGAEEHATALEYELFQELREAVNARAAAMQRTAAALAEVDALAALAERADTCRYVRPTMLEKGEIFIKDGRHPVVERFPESGRFVPNDTRLDTDGRRLVILTGPNMAGKSTYIKQVALIAIMAQMGSFVPAEEARIAVSDRVFTRVGAGDDISRGRSTFMVEMQETANILNNATEQSLIILDEIGRGTSTFDGISIAWAVAEHLHNVVRAKTLFATHYHELTDIALTLPGVKNCNVLVSEDRDRIVFLRKIGEGAADKSYGIAVANLAGLPASVVGRAKEILANLEESELSDIGQPKLAKANPRVRRPNPAEAVRQLSLFGEDA